MLAPKLAPTANGNTIMVVVNALVPRSKTMMMIANPTAVTTGFVIVLYRNNSLKNRTVGLIVGDFETDTCF